MLRGIVMGLSATMIVGIGPATAQEELAKLSEWLSGNVAVASDYAFRGISQTLEEPAVQGGLDLAHPSGLYLGTWASSLNFGEAALPRAQLELDVYGGFGFELGPVAAVDLGAIYYAYPGADDRGYNFLEFGLGASRAFSLLETGLTAAYSPDYFGGSGTSWYYGADVAVPISLVTISGSIGHQLIEENELFGTPDYTDWGIGLGVGVAGFDLSGRYIGTDLSDGDCFGGSDLCTGRAIFSVSRAM